MVPNTIVKMKSSVDLRLGDCLEVLPTLDADSADSVVCDPPYELGFMGKSWDRTGIAYNVAMWGEVLRVLKPGGHLLAMGSSRTYHRLAVAIEDAGFEIRDSLAWLYGQGFPKSLDVSKAIDKAAGVEREVTGIESAVPTRPITKAWRQSLREGTGMPLPGSGNGDHGHIRNITAPATPDAERWQGWGTALKPAMELICMARKPLSEATVAANVLRWGTGAVNVDGCRIAGEWSTWRRSNGDINPGTAPQPMDWHNKRDVCPGEHPAGRWPANVLLDEEAAAMLDAQNGEHTVGGGRRPGLRGPGIYDDGTSTIGGSIIGYGDTGGASRFFYCAKASRSERNAGCEGLPEVRVRRHGDTGPANDKPNGQTALLEGNHHPTVKPISLMRWLVRLVTPPGGVVLDPFLGSGSTGIAAVQEGFSFVGVEISSEYMEIAKRRIEQAQMQLALPLEAVG